mmetsp:Transcript_26007/g.29765  ORF Transcript_26007/g.29765 Transcript_26007/m.29765 type:complete len:88 (+) Transcript_26007:660-923(+)
MMLESRRLLLIYRYGCCYRRTASVIIAAEAQEEQHQSDLQGKKNNDSEIVSACSKFFGFFHSNYSYSNPTKRIQSLEKKKIPRFQSA